jgi:hypothetical protein
MYAFKCSQFHPRLAIGFTVAGATFITELRRKKKVVKKMTGGDGTWSG